MWRRLFRWLGGRAAPEGRPSDAGVTPEARPVATPAATTSEPPVRRTNWWVVPLVPTGVLAQVDVYALQYVMPIIYMTTNDIVFVVAGRTYLLDHERCEAADPAFAELMAHMLREADDAEERRRLARVMAIEATGLPVVVQAGETLERPGEPSTSREGPRVDLIPALLPEVSRVLASGDRFATTSLLALLDLLARFDGHSGGELEILASASRRQDRGHVRVGLGACGDEVFGDRLDAATRARVAAALAEGVADDGEGGLRVHALIDKCEPLSGCSGYEARLCLGRLAVTPAGFVYDDELLWSERERGIEYS